MDGERRSERGAAAGFGAAIGTGIALVVCKYALRGLADDATPDSLLRFGGIGLALAGAVVFRRMRAMGRDLPYPTAALAALAASGVVAGLSFAFLPRVVGLEDAPLAPVEIAGYRVDLPAWEVEQREDGYSQGVLSLRSPGGRGRFVQLRWAVGSEIDDEAMARYLGSAGPVEVKESRDVVVSGHPGRELTVDLRGGARFLVTRWHCDRDDRHAFLMTFLDLAPGDLASLHRRMVASIACHTLPPADRPALVHPAFDAPAGFRRVDHPSALLYLGADETTLFDFTVGTSDRKVADALNEVPGLRATVMAEELDLKGVVVEDAPVSVPADDGAVRTVWVGSGTAEGTPVTVFLCAWWCEARSLAFVGLFVAPAGIDRAAGAALLARARCP